jgi:prevent-host-death family protein
MKTIGAGQFKAKCLGILDEVQTKREPIIVTKNGRAVVKVVPLDEPDDPLAVFRYPGLEIVGDVTAPLYSDKEWEEFFERSAEQLK